MGRRLGGFTLVELLVVVTIIGILIALLLPAVQAARESARRLTCKGHLKQIGLAAQHHTDKYGFYPSSGWGYMYVGDPDMGVGARQPGGWMYDILPFLGLEFIHQIGAGLPGPGSGGQKYEALGRQQSSVVPLFHCPSRRKVLGYPVVWYSYNAQKPDVYAKTDYAANGGSGKSYLGQGPVDPSCNCMANFPNCRWQSWDAPGGSFTYDQAMDSLRLYFDGMSGLLSEVKPAHIVDGSSRTIFAAEKYMNPLQYYTGSGCADNTSCYQGTDWDVNRWVPTMNAARRLERRSFRPFFAGSRYFIALLIRLQSINL